MKPLTYSAALPTTYGLYFWRRKNGNNQYDEALVEVRSGFTLRDFRGTVLHRFSPGCRQIDLADRVEDMAGEWAGPILFPLNTSHGHERSRTLEAMKAEHADWAGKA